MRRRSEILMSAVNFGEAYGFVLRWQGADRARASLSTVYPLPMRFMDATVQRCCHAAEIKAKYKLYYVDSFAAALAIEHKATLVTADSDFRRLGHNFPVLWLKA
ncbi:MAG: PIN domain-containing protein [Candidatus Korobacteraceae bacterium]